ncbi:MAG: hypothetical protein SGBAC_010020 [Bacillariaceae sp.]
MTDPFENCSAILRMRQGGFLREDAKSNVETKVEASKPTSCPQIAYEDVDNYPAILRMRERRDPMDSLDNCIFTNAPIVKDNTMVRGSRQRSEARTPYEDRSNRSDTEIGSEAEDSETTESGTNGESSTSSTIEALPVMMGHPGRTQPNLVIPSAMSLEEEHNKYVFDDPIQEISVTESNILESFSMHSYASKRSRDTFDDDDDEKVTAKPSTKKDNVRIAASPLEASIMAMDAYYKKVIARPKPSVDPRIEEMKQIMLVFWKLDQTSATVLFSVSWQLSRRYTSIADFPTQPEPADEFETGSFFRDIQHAMENPFLRLFQKFFANQDTIVIPQYLCPPPVDQFMIFDWSNEIEGMESDEISDSDPAIDGILTVDRVLSLEDFDDDDEIFQFRNHIEEEDCQVGLENVTQDVRPSGSDDDDMIKFRGCIEDSHCVFESHSSVANSNIVQAAAYEPFSKLEKIIEEVNSNAETEESNTTSNATSHQDDMILPLKDDAGSAPSLSPGSVEEDARSNDTGLFPESLDTRSNDTSLFPKSHDDIMNIPTKSVVNDGGMSVEESQDDTENSGDWGNTYGSNSKNGKLSNMPIESAFDMAIKGIRSIETENNSTTRRGPREGSIRSRDALSVASEQTHFTHDCVSENLVDRFLTTLEVALCLR